MTFIQTAPPGGGIPIYVRGNAKLQGLQAEAERLRVAIRELETRLTAIEVERQRGDQNPSDSRWEARRVELRTQYSQAEVALQTAKHQLKQAEQQYQQWLENFATWQYQSTQLQRELASAKDTDGGYDFVITNNGGPPPRSKTEVEDELLAVTKKLALFSDDAGLAREYQELEKRILSSKPYVVLTTDYICLATGEIVSQQEFQERACKFGDSVSRGATSSPYRKNAHVDRAEAAKLGLV